MLRFVSRPLLVDATLAAALTAVTALSFASVYSKLKVPFVDAFTMRQAFAVWWLFGSLIIVGLLIRRYRPLLALALVGIGVTAHQLDSWSPPLPLDLAVPVALYSVASLARRRWTAIWCLAAALAITYGLILAPQVTWEAASTGTPDGSVVTGPSGLARLASAMIVTTPTATRDLLLLVVAFAVGDAVRSRREHLRLVEREHQQRTAMAAAAERARITRELHDVVAHGMSVMVVQAHGAAAALNRHPERTATALQHVIETGRASLAEMRRLLALERAEPDEGPQLAPQPGITAVPSLVDQMRTAGVDVTLHIEGAQVAVPPSVDLSAYRIVQEALTNVLKHAEPGATATVRLEFEAERLRVEVTDDGAAPVDGGNPSGVGLLGIADRVAMLGGELTIGRVAGTGFQISASLPLAERSMATAPGRPA
ncbi:signal transduction histidine kinase [Hamadaea flava]|uniref:histidine kinase n=1 Tax=Hamadaea flava TaxID=1742688 RepID=A0ABV8M0P8_9ACTN|nr:histidine kinase [Hamadaea flava]MCP2322167.1 signal transduction histidine kinase [Hamadaea flava]